jgi:UDP-N-acetylmuramate dehydrogenase
MKTLYNLPVHTLSTYGGKGVVNTMFLPETVDEFVSVMSTQQGLHVLGGGSNTIMADGKIPKILSTKLLDRMVFEGDEVRVQCGARLPRLIKECAHRGLGGLGFLAGVPASVGGAVRMNAGAFDNEIGVYITKMTVLSAGCVLKDIYPPYNFSYRHGAEDTVVEVTLRLQSATREECERDCQTHLERRKHTQPKGRSIGSTFKNTGLGAGYYLDQAGLKGLTVGGAQISTKHANFILNVGDGSAQDFLSLVQIAKGRVQEEFGVELQEEFIFLGEQ